MKFFSTLQAFAVIALGTAFLSAAAPISSSEIEEKSAQGLRLLSLSEDAEPVWKTEDEKLELKKQDVHFFDVTETYELEQSLPKKKAAAVTCESLPHNAFQYTNMFVFFSKDPSPSHQSAVKPLLSTLSVSNMQSNLNSLTAFNNRYYRSSTGRDASQFILDTVKKVSFNNSKCIHITV